MFNRFIGTGVVSSQPFLKQTKSGLDCLSVKIGFYSDRNGKTETLELECELFGKSAADGAKDLKEGLLVVADGELRNNSWTDAQGNTKAKLRLYANKIFNLEAVKPKTSYNNNSVVKDLFDKSQDDDDVPF